VLAIEHLTRNYLWQPRYLDHPNGAVALTELVVCVDDVETAARRYARYFGIPVTRNGIVSEISLKNGKFKLLGPAGLRNIYGIDPPTLPFAASVSIAVENIAETERLLDGNGVAVTRPNGCLMVAGADANGAHVVFEPLFGKG
jgi:hypothetical protein